MENTCKLSYCWNWDTYFKASCYGKKFQMRLRPPFIIAISVGAILISVLGIFMLLDPSTDIGTRFYGGGMILWAIYWLFFRRKVGEWIFRRHFKKEDAANKKIDWIFSKEMVTSNCEGLVKAEMSWLLLIKLSKQLMDLCCIKKEKRLSFGYLLTHLKSQMGQK